VENKKIFAVACPSLHEFMHYMEYLLRNQNCTATTITGDRSTRVIDDKIFIWFNGTNIERFYGLKLYSIIKIGEWYRINHQELNKLEVRLHGRT
jgi:hypothetical protein